MSQVADELVLRMSKATQYRREVLLQFLSENISMLMKVPKVQGSWSKTKSVLNL